MLADVIVARGVGGIISLVLEERGHSMHMHPPSTFFRFRKRRGGLFSFIIVLKLVFNFRTIFKGYII